MCVCVCVCACLRGTLQNGQANYTLSFGASNDQIHTKYVQMAGFESIHLNIVYVLSGLEQLGENPMRVNILAILK